MKLTVESVHYEPGSTIATAIGVDENGQRWHFAGDWRPMRDVAEALKAGEDVKVDVESWQIMGKA